ncbi:MAG: glycosyltransferase family 4 protein [Burkholderiaceae bacterium]|nr:glycosyltransferase family 4 protein [Burkholderiaceae bacterium]
MTSTSYPQDGQDWRGRFIYNLTAALSRLPGLQLDLWAPPGELPPGVSSVATSADRNWLQLLSQRGGIAHLLRGSKPAALWAAMGLLCRLHRAYRRRPTTVVHVNWLQNALPLWGTRTPAVISVLGTDFGLLRLPGMATLLHRVLRQRRAVLAPNAEWMVPELRQRFGDVARVQAVPFGIDRIWFDVERLQPPTGRPKRWLVVARLTREKIGDLFDWGSGLFNGARELHLFGPMQEALTLPDWVHYHGPTHPAALLQDWIPEACGLITLSRHDEGRPQVVLEMMAAGLPVIASDLPAHRDIIDNRRTGFLADSPQTFALALARLEEPEVNATVGDAARLWVRETCGTWDDCAARFADLYVDLSRNN